MPFPTTLWSGENDLDKFETWLVELISWMSGNGWKGKGYNEQHIDALSHALDGDPKQIMLHFEAWIGEWGSARIPSACNKADVGLY